MTGNCNEELWESLHELLNDSGCINLATGEQLRLHPNLRYLFVMPNAGGTPRDTFSRSAIVYTNPPPPALSLGAAVVGGVGDAVSAVGASPRTEYPEPPAPPASELAEVAA